MDPNRQSELKRVKSKTGPKPRDRDLQGGARGGDPDAKPRARPREEPPIIERTP